MFARGSSITCNMRMHKDGDGDLKYRQTVVYEKDEAVIASCEIPGLKSKEDIRIEIGENMLSLGGNIKREHEVREENVHRQERYWGSFRRSVALPAPVIAGESKASYRNGVLEITMPKAQPRPQRKNIDIDFH